MRILITTGIFPPDIGGPATYVPAIAEALVKRMHQVTVLTTSEPKHINWDDSAHPFPVIRMNRRQRIWQRLLNYLAQILRYGRTVEVIYANGIYFETALANRFLSKPLVMRIVSDEAWERSLRKSWTSDNFEDFQHKHQNWQAEFFKRLRSWYVKQADKVIVPCEYLKRTVTKWGVSEEKCIVVYNAVEVNLEHDQVPRFPPTFLNGQLRVITVGRLVALKNIDKLLEAVALVPQVTLTIVGDGPCRHQWESLARTLDVSDRVWFTGILPKSTVHALMSQHDVFAIISNHESFPFSVLEAMKLGLVVIASPVGGNIEIIQNGINGLLVEPKPEIIAHALELLMTNPALRQQLALAGRQSVRERFSYDHMVNQVEKILQMVIHCRN